MTGGRLTLPLFVFLGASLVSRAQVVSSGTIEIPGTYEFDFDAGVITLSPAADVFWEQFTSTTRSVQPINGATIVNLGTSVNFNSLTPAQLQALTYGSSGIDGSNGTSLLVVGDVFAVHTNSGNYAKAVVSKPLDSQQNNGLIIQWATYPPGPIVEIPGTYEFDFRCGSDHPFASSGRVLGAVYLHDEGTPADQRGDHCEPGNISE